MALSCYSNCSFPQAEPELPLELLSFQHGFFLDQNPSLDPIFEPLSDFSSHITISEPFPAQHFGPFYPSPKRIKIHEDNDSWCNYTDSEQPSLFNDGSTLCPTLIPDSVPSSNFRQNLQCSFPVFSTSAKEGNSTTLAQSIAARRRRRKITDKTQELGKLIPGAHKMNTAEMFQAAYKYIKILQAQVGILQFMHTIQDDEDDLYTQQLQQLVSTSRMQQKLYCSEIAWFPNSLCTT